MQTGYKIPIENGIMKPLGVFPDGFFCKQKFDFTQKKGAEGLMKIGLVLEEAQTAVYLPPGDFGLFYGTGFGKGVRYVIGTSTGTGNAMNFISTQHGCSRDTTITKDKRYAYFGLKNIIRDRASVRYGKYLLEGAHRI